MVDLPRERIVSDDKLDYLIKTLEAHDKASEAWKKGMETRMDLTERQLFLYKTIIHVIKWIFGGIVLLVSLRFGDLAKYIAGHG